MTLRAWLAKAMSEGDQPSSKRLVYVVGLLVLAPVALGAALWRAPASFGEAFTAYVIAVGGSYAASRFAEKTPPAPPPSAP